MTTLPNISTGGAFPRRVINCFVNEKCLIALCVDGTIWSLGNLSACWIKLPAIPSDEEYEKQSKGELERLNLLMGQGK